MFNKQTFAKIAGWLGALLAAGSAQGVFGKYSGIVALGGAVLSGAGIHQASNTSADNPSGAK